MLYALPNGQSVDYPTFVAGLKKPGDAIVSSLTPEKADAWHMGSCIPGEVGELFDCLKVHFEGGELDRENLVEELGDIEFYMEGLRAPLGLAGSDTLSYGAPLVEGKFTSPLAVLHLLPGLAANVFDISKRWYIYGKDLDLEGLRAAMGALDLAIGNLRDYFGIRREDVLAANVTKLGTRYQTLAYSDKEAQDRADKKDQ